MDIQKQTKLDWFLILAVASQIVLGLFLMHSISLSQVERFAGDSLFFFHRHIGSLVVSLVSAIVLFRYWSTDFVRKHVNLLLAAAFLLVCLTLIPGLGANINGASRWLRLGSLILYPQPIAIFLLALFVSNLLAINFKNNHLRTKPTLILAAVATVFIVIKSFQPDFTSSVLLIALILLMCCIAGWYKFVAISLIGGSLFTFILAMTAPYRLARIVGWFDPFSHRFDTGYQLVLSLSSVGGGGVSGVGYGEGVIKGRLPEVQGGFIYAALVEELGVVGGLLALTLAAFICWRCFTVAYRLMAVEKKFDGLLVYFLSFWMALLAIFHVSGVLGLVPIFNSPFPFLSYGGTYLFVFILSIAVILKLDLKLQTTQESDVVMPKIYKRPIFWIVLLSFGAVGCSLTSKAVFDHKLDKEYEKYRSAFQSDVKKEGLAGATDEKRGRILDRFGKVLAKNISAHDVWVDPSEFDFESGNLLNLSVLLGLDADKMIHRIKTSKAKGRHFTYLKRGVEPDVEKEVYRLKIGGVNYAAAEKRFYPFGESVAHVVGLTDIDGEGLEGVELSFDKYLLNSKTDGTIRLSIDQRIQDIVFSSLKNTASKNQIKRGVVIVVDAKNGEVLAMASYPSFDPNDRSVIQMDSVINRGVSSRIEPGAMIAPFVLMGAMNHPEFRNSPLTVDTTPGYFKIGEHTIKDPRNYGQLSLADMLDKYSKVGLSKVALSIPKKTLWQTLDNFGFGFSTKIELSAEVSGYLPHWETWSDIETGTISYGYGLLVTPLQLAQAYLSLANNGVMSSLTLLKGDRSKGANLTFVPPAVAWDFRFYLERDPVSAKNSGSKVRIAGKRALVQKYGPAAYSDRFTGIFAGMAPIEDPRYVAVVMLDEAAIDKQSVARLAEKIFRDIAESLAGMVWE